MPDRPASDAAVASLLERDARHVWHPYAPMPIVDAPVAVAGAHGNRLELADGREVIDGMSSWWAAIHGYNHPTLNQALVDQTGRMAHVMFGGLTHGPAVELAELLVSIVGGELDHTFFVDSGSVAVEVAMKMALQYARGTGRPGAHRFLTVRNGYHGDTLGAMSVCDPVNGMHAMFADVLPSQLFAPAPTPAFGKAFTAEDISSFADILDQHGDEIAAVILEPVVQGAGGMRFYAPDYLKAVRELCDTHGVLLIADEIATGFGRSGALFGCDHADVHADIVCLGKALTGGYLSMAATLCTPAVAAGVTAAESGALMHGPTFMANPLAAAVSLASVRLLLDRPWQAEVAMIERRLSDGLAPARGLHGVSDVRVLGAIGVIEMNDPLVMASTQERLLDSGVWLRPFGKLLYTMPPYCTPVADVDRVAAAMVDVASTVPA